MDKLQMLRDRLELVLNILFLRCACGLSYMERIHRRPWMRLFPLLRYYRCAQCGKTQLASQRATEEAIAERISREVARQS